MAYISTQSEIRLTDDMERRLAAQMAREQARSGFVATIKQLGSGVMQCATAFGAFLDAYADTVDEAGRRASHHGHYL